MLDPKSNHFSYIYRNLPELLKEKLETEKEDTNETRFEIIPENCELEESDDHPFPSRSMYDVGGYQIHLVVRGMGETVKWTFHQYDDDPHPSIPHGHKYAKKHPKCDPYTGRVFDMRRNEMTQDRLSIAARNFLWNNSDFREFSLRSIGYYSYQHPEYRFTDSNPYRLPRKRR
jgi:hypothetical protein